LFFVLEAFWYFLLLFHYFENMATAYETLLECGEIQKKLFFKSFLSNHRIGEIICINGVDNEDSFMFEHFMVRNIDIVVAYRLMCEDSMIVEKALHFREPIQHLVDLINRNQDIRWAALVEKFNKMGKTIEDVKKDMREAGKNTDFLNRREFTRDDIEEDLAPGRKRISGDRNSEIQILQRQTDIPSDLQRPAVNRYVLPMPEKLQELMELSEEEVLTWKGINLVQMPVELDMGSHFPMLMERIDVVPSIYEFPEKEVDIERALNK
jgi:hypothetical protein